MQNVNDLSYNIADWQTDETSSNKTAFVILTETPEGSNTTENAVFIGGSNLRVIQSLALAIKKDEQIKSIVIRALTASVL